MIRSSLTTFVPRRVQELIEDNAPEAPLLDKREANVTVLFADISGYTRLSARLAPEILDALVQRYFEPSSTRSSSTGAMAGRVGAAEAGQGGQAGGGEAAPEHREGDRHAGAVHQDADGGSGHDEGQAEEEGGD